MAAASRLIALVLLLCSGGAHAATGTWTVGGTCANPTLAATASCWVANANTLAGNVLPYWRYFLGTVNESAGTFVVNRQHCNVVSGCVAQAPVTQTGTFTPDPVDPEEEHCASINGSPVKASWVTSSPSLSSRTICMSNAGYSCTATVEGDICGGSGGGSYLCHGSGVSGGAKCTPSPEPDAPPPVGNPETNWPEAPPPGTCPGTVNGVAVNVPCSNTTTKGTTTSESNDGEGNTTVKSESKSTVCNEAGSCTTTTTTTTTVNGGTPKTTTNSTTQGKGEFCAANRGAKECGNGDGSSFGGNCQASFVCTGDAVQCATAKAVNDSLCKFKDVFEMDESTSALVGKVLAGTWEKNPKDEPRTEPLGTFDQTNPLSGACPGDVAISIASATVVIPLARFCPQLQMMGNLLVAFTLLGATVFVFRGTA